MRRSVLPAMVDWALAQRVASGALLLKPAPATYRSSALQGQFDDLTARAETLVSEATGLHSGHGSARAKVTDRPGWAAANVRSIERLVGPALLELQQARGAKLGGPSLVVGRTVAGTQLGLMLAYMATRVLGQYDLLINDETPEDQDLVSYVGPNIVAVEEQYDFAPERVPALAGPARGDPPDAVHRRAVAARPLRRAWSPSCSVPCTADPANFAEMVKRMATEVRAGPQPGRRGRASWACWPRPSSACALSKISGMMSLLEGPRRRDHGPGRGGRSSRRRPVLPGAARAAHQRQGPDQAHVQAARPRRQNAPVRRGRAFVEAVEAAGGPVLLARVWEGPEWLPTLEEIRDPGLWVARAGG